jgi:hypothetical protein
MSTIEVTARFEELRALIACIFQTPLFQDLLAKGNEKSGDEFN